MIQEEKEDLEEVMQKEPRKRNYLGSNMGIKAFEYKFMTDEITFAYEKGKKIVEDWGEILYGIDPLYHDKVPSEISHKIGVGAAGCYLDRHSCFWTKVTFCQKPLLHMDCSKLVGDGLN